MDTIFTVVTDENKFLQHIHNSLSHSQQMLSLKSYVGPTTFFVLISWIKKEFNGVTAQNCNIHLNKYFKHKFSKDMTYSLLYKEHNKTFTFLCPFYIHLQTHNTYT